jgi:hypothetical protein
VFERTHYLTDFNFIRYICVNFTSLYGWHRQVSSNRHACRCTICATFLSRNIHAPKCNICMCFCYSSCMAKFSCILLLHMYINILRVGFFLRKCLCTKIILHIKRNVCNLYKSTFLNRSEPNFAQILRATVYGRQDGGQVSIHRHMCRCCLCFRYHSFLMKPPLCTLEPKMQQAFCVSFRLERVDGWRRVVLDRFKSLNISCNQSLWCVTVVQQTTNIVMCYE